MTNVGEYDPSVKAGFTADDALHRRNQRSLVDFLRSRHIGSPQLAAGAVTSNAMGPNSVTDDAVSDVSIDKVTAGTLHAIVTLAGAIQAGNLSFDSDHMSLLDANGAVLFELPAAGGEPFLRGQVEATGLLVENDFVLRGANNLIQEGAQVRMGGAATGQTLGNPSAAPGLAITDETVSFGTGVGSFGRFGLFHDATNTSFWTAQGTKAYEYNDNGAFIRSFTIGGAQKIFGVVRVGTRVYVLFENLADEHMVNAYAESNFAFLGQINLRIRIGSEIQGDPALGDDGTNLIVVDLDAETATAKFRFHKFTRADTPAFVSTTVSSGAGNPTLDATVEPAHGARGFVAAESSWWVAAIHPQIGNAGVVYAFSTAGVFQANKEFRSRNGQAAQGLAHDGTRFWSGDSSNLITKHSNWIWTTESDLYEAVYTYVDDNGAVSAGARPLGAGDFETKASPKATIRMRRRTRLRITGAAVTTAGLVNPPTHVGFYLRRQSDAGSYDFQADVAVVSGVGTTTTRIDYATDAIPETPPATNNFPGGTATGNFAQFLSSAGAPILRGDGYSRIKVKKTVAQSIANSTDVVVDFASSTKTPSADVDAYVEVANDRIKFPFDGQYLVIASCRWATDTTDQRKFWAEHSVDGAVWTDLSNDGLTDTREGMATHNTAMVMSNIINVAIDDYLRLMVRQNSGGGVGALDLNSWNLSVLFLGDA